MTNRWASSKGRTYVLPLVQNFKLQGARQRRAGRALAVAQSPFPVAGPLPGARPAV